MIRSPLSRRLVRRAMVLAVSVALVPLPAFAGALSTPEKPAQPPPQVAGTIKPVQPLRAAIEKIDASDFKPTTSSRDAPRRAAQDTTASKQSPAFFKSGTGITVLAVVAAGVGYALYSTSHDRVHSPGKD